MNMQTTLAQVLHTKQQFSFKMKNIDKNSRKLKVIPISL